MKKLFLIISLCLFATKVYAFEEGVWTDEVINDPNVIIASSEIRYHWYREITNKSPDYYFEGENDSHYVFH